MDKTPKFTKAINEILKNLTPYGAKCFQCKLDFEISENDIDFFKRFQVPPSKMCPDCRRQRRFAFINYTTLFKRKCDAPNHNEKVISSIPEGTGFPVFDFDYYWYGDRDWFINGRNFDFNESFLKQFKELFMISPQPALTRDPASINSDYASYGAQLKNCYYTFGGINVENTMFSVWPMSTKDSLDLLISVNNNLLYEGVYPNNSYNCHYVYFSSDCLDCNFIYDCRNCNDCFGCVNLRNKKYCIWNIQYSEKDYLEKIKEFNLGNRQELEKVKMKFNKMIFSLPIRATRNEHSENVLGNYLVNSKNCINVMWAMDSENLTNTDFVMKLKDSYDCTVSAIAEQLYSTSGVGNNCFNVKLSSFGRELQDCEYTMNCKNCQYCFGCIGLVNAKFYIFNKQYIEEEYWKTVDAIKVKMIEGGEYGEFFPISLSPFPYNASLSNIIYNISKEKALGLGGWWYDDKINLPENMKLLKMDEIESNIKNVPDDILNVGIISEGNGKPFRIIKEELDFYRRKNIAIPSLTPYERIVARFKYVNNFKVFTDNCFNCKKEILSSYATSDGFNPYCEDCYKKEVY
ncbi:MAG TPA: hypothetical protein VMR49_00085 [Candidatus Paceibacterota bacterium]|jgi:hypothetical protein|nr:hypothetical protein [Candidatus Paceibacterota bacterium]